MNADNVGRKGIVKREYCHKYAIRETVTLLFLLNKKKNLSQYYFDIKSYSSKNYIMRKEYSHKQSVKFSNIIYGYSFLIPYDYNEYICNEISHRTLKTFLMRHVHIIYQLLSYYITNHLCSEQISLYFELIIKAYLTRQTTNKYVVTVGIKCTVIYNIQQIQNIYLNKCFNIHIIFKFYKLTISFIVKFISAVFYFITNSSWPFQQSDTPSHIFVFRKH
ncbi:hypothetical protein AGLY_003133 [Aphis glycines]|uniref:Uncharacterized protein n=1 Tax=Aphis glycines TaxID=307491 RepID=A0A6G0U4L3_APHGL|nr:hypothetical protein AGLY_003133 [Aphis glycines]